LADVGDDRDPARYRRFKGEGSAKFACGIKQLRTVFRKQRFVGGHHIFAALQ